jgi:hypothetical protein
MAPRVGTRWLYGALLTGCLGGFEPADAAYVIRLKNGNEYLTTRYWQEGAQVRFDTYGGVFGVDRTFVAKIERTSQAIPLPISAVAEDRPAAKELQAPAVSSPKDPSGKQAEQGPKVVKPAETAKEPAKKDENVLKQYAELQARFGQLNDLPHHEIHALDGDIASFREKLINSALAEAHQDELDAMRTLQGAIASYLKASRR